MREEINQIINQSGTKSQNEMIVCYREHAKKNGLSESKIHEKLGEDNFRGTLDDLNHQIVLNKKSITDDEILEILAMIVNEKPLTRKLFLRANQLTDASMPVLCRELRRLGHLNFLDLRSNRIGEQGFYAIFRLVAQKPKIQLSLGGNLIHESGLVEQIKQKALFDYNNNY